MCYINLTIKGSYGHSYGILLYILYLDMKISEGIIIDVLIKVYSELTTYIHDYTAT